MPVVDDPDPSVAALPLGAVLSAAIGTLDPVAVGDAFWAGAGVGEPKLSCWAKAAPWTSMNAEARIKVCFFMFNSHCPADRHA